MGYWGYMECRTIEHFRLDCNYYHPKYLKMISLLKKFNTKTLKEISNKIVDHSFLSIRTEDYVENGIPFIRVTNLNGLFIDDNNIIYITQEAHLNEAQTIFNSGDILFSKTGRVATSIIPRSMVECNTSQDVMGVKLRQEVDPYYLTTFFNSKYGVLSQVRKQTGQVQMHLTLGYLKTLEALIPSERIQKLIGDKVRKAEILREEARQLIIEAETIFKLLLKDDYIYNNNAGNPSLYFNQKPVYLYVGQVDINERLDAQSFHPEFFLTIDRIKSLGLKTVRLHETIDFHDTGISSPQYGISGTPIIMTKNIKNSCISQIENYVLTDTISESNLLATEDVLFTTYGGPSIGKVDILFGSERSTFDYTILRMRFKNKFNPYFMLLLLRSKYVQNQVRYMIKGTTGITFVNPKDVLKVIIPVVPPEVQNEIGLKIKRSHDNVFKSLQLIAQAKQDVEDLIEGKFDESKISEGV